MGVNPLNITQSYDTIGIIDAVFKVCTSELFNLYNLLWKDNEHYNEELYNLLPKKYKTILFNIRGINFKIRSKYNNGNLKFQNVYGYLKSIETKELEEFLKYRKLMINW